MGGGVAWGLAGVCGGRGSRIVGVDRPVLAITGVGGGFKDAITLGSMSLAMCPKRVEKLVKRGKSKGSAIASVMTKVRRYSDNTVAFRKRD